MGRILAIPPVVGEFGWTLFDIQPKVRAYFDTGADKKIVFAPSELWFLFEQATNFVDVPKGMMETPPEWRSTHGVVKGDREELKRLNRLLLWASSMVPKEAVFLDLPYESTGKWDAPERHIRLESKRGAPDGEYVVVACRDRKFGDRKNWPHDRWDELVEEIRALTGDLPIYSIGTPSGAYFPRGTLPVVDLPGRLLERSVATLNGAAFSVSSNSGATHLSLLSGCPTFCWGEPRLKRRMTKTTNPLGVDCRFLATGWQPSVAGVARSLKEWLDTRTSS